MLRLIMIIALLSLAPLSVHALSAQVCDPDGVVGSCVELLTRKIFIRFRVALG